MDSRNSFEPSYHHENRHDRGIVLIDFDDLFAFLGNTSRHGSGDHSVYPLTR
ncbi:hypothetical protein RRSWK_02872 [Rhodopirellula sp. SWK7]|nr:hypothetical protein RRSWK_02872 [Rhodopirellula sp. SWK7]